MDFTIQIDFSPEALDAIALAGQRVTLVRSVQSFVSSQQSETVTDAFTPETAVAWLVFSPKQTNRIQWDERCDLYAAAMLPPLLGVINLEASTTNAQPGETWKYQNGHFSRESASARSDYRAGNQQDDDVCLGLISAATVNDHLRPAAPLNIQQALLNEKVLFSIADPQTVTIFLSNVVADGSIVPDGISGLDVTLASGSPLKVGFNDARDAFFIAS